MADEQICPGVRRIDGQYYEEWDDDLIASGRLVEPTIMDAMAREIAALRAEVERLKREVNYKDEVLRAKNRALDSLHYVWCSGGCETGAHRYDGLGPDGITEELVREAIRQVDRMIAFFGARIGRKQWQDLDELKKQRFTEDAGRVARAENEARQQRERAERAEALLAMARVIDLATCVQANRFDGNRWYIRREEPYAAPYSYLNDQGQWMTRNPHDPLPLFDSLDAAIAAYEQGWETTDGH